ncbi:MAG: hypothetical protein AAGJ46_16910 [Planctomycetota bacterium]
MHTQSPPEYQQLLQVAETLFRQDPDWVTFFREVLGIDGAIRRTFPSFDDLAAFERSSEYDLIQKMVVKLREKKPTADAESEPTRVITVRLPKSMHEYLRTEAHDLRTSMNKLCISKLLQVIEQDKIPAERSGAPKRRTSTPAVSQPTAQPATAQPAALHAGASGNGHGSSLGHGGGHLSSDSSSDSQPRYGRGY